MTNYDEIDFSPLDDLTDGEVACPPHAWCVNMVCLWHTHPVL